MAEHRVLGVTGAFGSGCTTSAKCLRDERQFKYVRLSGPISDRWVRENPSRQASRRDLQRLGDQMRSESGLAVLVNEALPKADDDLAALTVVDGIRNTGEVRALRERFGDRFVLLALVSSLDARWSRISSIYTDKDEGRDEFLDDDMRDQGEASVAGQQVHLCVDLADVVIDNSEEVNPTELKSKVKEYSDLVTRLRTRPPTKHEIHMNMAYASAHSSRCLKRHVGAVVIKDEQVVGVGYNENPIRTKPCAEEPTYSGQCYKDIFRRAALHDLTRRGVRCPVCGQTLRFLANTLQCMACADVGTTTNVEDYFFLDRAMYWCTAVHAEVWAILAAGERVRGGSIYTTTFPCFQCCEKIIQAGIKAVWYTEPYPDAVGQDRLKLAGVELQRFEGVRSASFERIFSPSRPS